MTVVMSLCSEVDVTCHSAAVHLLEEKNPFCLSCMRFPQTGRHSQSTVVKMSYVVIS
jgi:hypothetical protein